MKPHTPYSEVLEIVEDVKKTGADCILTLGGGSLIDGAKAVAFVCHYLRPSMQTQIFVPFTVAANHPNGQLRTTPVLQTN